jgi:putative DNA primase/helicase
MNAQQTTGKPGAEPGLNGDARQHAALLRARGFALCKPDPAEKKPTYPRWGTRSKEAGDFGPCDMIGVIAGPLSDANRPGYAVVIIDLDAPEAVEQADEFLPATAMEDGRPAKPRSHRYYLIDLASIPQWAESPAEQAAEAARERAGQPGPFKKSFHRADTDKTAIDFIGTGGQAVAPPSSHPSGEHREWVGGKPGEPANVSFPDLWLAVCRLAESCGCKPASGTRWPWEDRPEPPPRAFTARATGPHANVEARATKYLAKIPAAVSGEGGHARSFYAARVLVYGFDLGPELGFRLLKEHYNPRCEPEWTDRQLWHKAEDADRLAHRKPRGWLLSENRRTGAAGDGPDGPAGASATDDGPKPIEAADDPHRLARLYLDQQCRHADGVSLRFWRQEWHRWDESAYRTVPDKELRAELTQSAKAEMDRLNVAAQTRAEEKGEDQNKGKPITRKVTGRMIADVAHALASLIMLPSRTEAPAWIGSAAPFDPAEVLACRNGLVYLPALISGRDHFLAPTPRFFSPNALDFDFGLGTPEPSEWLAFLRELWPNDPQSIDTLQEWFGYQLTADTRQQKMLLLVGPKRSGKGTIARVMRGLIGPENAAGPTLASMSTNFGLWPLLGKSAAIISDARLSGRTDTAIVTERLLSISGEDAQTVDRKNLPPVTVKLAVRFSVLTNELPRLGDPSGALTGRMILLRLTESWYGKEDVALTDRLLAERPGILLWAIAGWQRLRERGHFVQPDEGRELLNELHDLSSPVGAFVRDRCRVGPGCRVAVADLFAAWKQWCETQGRKEAGTEAMFGRDLLAAVATLRRVRPRDGEDRYRAYEGIGLR